MSISANSVPYDWDDDDLDFDTEFQDNYDEDLAHRYADWNGGGPTILRESDDFSFYLNGQKL